MIDDATAKIYGRIYDQYIWNVISKMNQNVYPLNRHEQKHGKDYKTIITSKWLIRKINRKVPNNNINHIKKNKL